MKTSDRFKRLIQHLHAVDTSDHNRRREIQCVLQALYGSYGFRLKQNSVSHTLHSKYCNFVPYQFGQNLFFKTPVMSIHDIERHLHSVKSEAVARGELKHVEMNARIFVTGESNVF